MSGGTQGNLVLVFTRGGEQFSLKPEHLRGVVPFPDPSRVPGAPDLVLGLVGWRGAVLPVVEPANATGESPGAAVIIATDGGEVALAADEVIGWHDAGSATRPIDPEALYESVRDAVRRAMHEPQSDE